MNYQTKLNIRAYITMFSIAVSIGTVMITFYYGAFHRHVPFWIIAIVLANFAVLYTARSLTNPFK